MNPRDQPSSSLEYKKLNMPLNKLQLQIFMSPNDLEI